MAQILIVQNSKQQDRKTNLATDCLLHYVWISQLTWVFNQVSVGYSSASLTVWKFGRGERSVGLGGLQASFWVESMGKIIANSLF